MSWLLISARRRLSWVAVADGGKARNRRNLFAYPRMYYYLSIFKSSSIQRFFHCAQLTIKPRPRPGTFPQEDSSVSCKPLRELVAAIGENPDDMALPCTQKPHISCEEFNLITRKVRGICPCVYTLFTRACVPRLSLLVNSSNRNPTSLEILIIRHSIPNSLLNKLSDLLPKLNLPLLRLRLDINISRRLFLQNPRRPLK